MKKILYVLIAVLLLSGCEELTNTPIKKTEEFLKKYQTLDSAVLSDLDDVIASNTTMDDNQKEEYKKIMKKHYQNLVYEVKDEVIDGDNATVIVEITVTDFNKVMDEASRYLSENLEEFNDEFGEYSAKKYMDYQLTQMKETKEKVKYTINIYLTKVNDEWTINEPNQATYDKINGIYNY